MDSLNEVLVPEPCINCLIRASCSINYAKGTLCEEADKFLRKIIFSYNKKGDKE